MPNKFSFVSRTPLPIVDDHRRVYAVCAGVPKNNAGWDSLQMRAATLLEASRHALVFNEKNRKSRRGKFSAINVGISHGGGQTHPMVLSQEPKNAPILKELMADKAFHRISGFSAGAFASWAPRLYRYQNGCVTKLIENDQQLRRDNTHPYPDDEELRRNWPKTPWASAALNFGPQTVCFRHADYNNLAFGWCAITALGSYDYKKGGHLVLWDLKLVIEFPPGSMILIPSSAIRHSNTRIQAGEQRYSFTQYSAGGLFRWLENSFKTVEDHRSTLGPEQTACLLDDLSNQLEFGLSLFSTVEELEKARNISITVPPPKQSP
ncbi:hypothetical protein GALMADRAFT_71350 [Galerina marginata CBS 339.88]|uniref:Uncharacterized protein n=1 Tax=Galerina marginata (strain CBS 339.88) TaxID=685588 RepID=A0A067T587_GALM3|nr:hypothetical protein GALMADRAFT_71350 [Galerina marginata CBS 339.88]